MKFGQIMLGGIDFSVSKILTATHIRCHKMQHMEMNCASIASAFSLDIQVLTPEYGTLSFGQNDDPTILLAYNGHNHYDAVLPKQANSPSAPPVESANIPCATSVTLEVTPDQPAQSHIAEASSIQPFQTDDDGSFLIISANVTSLRKNWSLLRHLSAKAFFCQETTLNQQGQNSMLRTLKSDNFHCVLGKPCGYKLSGSQTKFSLWNATSGGLATIAPCTQPIQKVMCTTDAFQNGRCSLTWIPLNIGRRGFYVFNLYGFVGASSRNPRALAKNEELLLDVSQTIASLGAVPILWVGDFQTSPEQSPTLGSLVQSGLLIDLGANYTNSAWTFQKGNNTNIRARIDLAMCNKEFSPFVSSMDIVRDSGFPGHCPLQIRLNIPSTLDTKFVYRQPKRLDISMDLSDNEAVTLDQSLWAFQRSDFDRLCDECVSITASRDSSKCQNKINQLFQIWSSTAEKFILSGSGKTNPVTAAHRGRGRMPKIIQQPLAAAPLNESFGAGTTRLLGMLKLQRRLQQLQCQLHSDHSNLESLDQHLSLCVNIQRNWQRLFNVFLDLHTIDSSMCSNLLVQIHDRINSEQARIQCQRLQTFKQKMVSSWESDKKEVFSWIKDSEPFVVPCFKTSDHEYATQHKDLHEQILKFGRQYSTSMHLRFPLRSKISFTNFQRVSQLPFPTRHSAHCQCPTSLKNDLKASFTAAKPRRQALTFGLSQS